MEDLFIGILCLVFLSTFLFALDLDNTKGNENTQIIVFDNSGETIYPNPDNYRFGTFGVVFEKSGERITTKNYKVITKIDN